MDGFWMEVERIRQRDELREEDGSGGEGRPPEGKEPGQGCGPKGGARAGARGRGPGSDQNTGGLDLWDCCGIFTSLPAPPLLPAS